MKKKSSPDRIVDYILTRNIDELGSLTVENIAATLDMNRCSLARAFKNGKAFTIEEFLAKIKIIHSAEILKNSPKMKIKDVAKKMGFARCDYFIRIFKRYFGTTPSRYRLLVRKQLLP